MIEVLVLPIGTPLQVGVYTNNRLDKTYKDSQQCSESLPLIFDTILKEYRTIDQLYFINGPGSYLAIKITYLFLSTLSITLNIPLKAALGFYFNGNSPIKALGKKYFFYHNNNIELKPLTQHTHLQPFELPLALDQTIFHCNTLPEYNLPAV